MSVGKTARFRLAAGILAAILAGLPGSARAASRVTALEGPSIRVDFEAPFVERWLAAPPADLETVVIPRREAIDWNRATDPETWAGAALLGPLVRPEPETEFRAFYTREALFLRARSHFDPADPPRAALRERDRWLDGEDMIEIRLRRPTLSGWAARFRPGGSAAPLFHFIVNAAGAIYDARDGDTAHDPEWHHSVSVGEGAWTLWAMIPFPAIELDGPPPELEINIGRDGSAAPILSWGPSWADTAQRRIVFEGISARPDAPRETGQETAGEPGAAGALSGRGISLDWVTGTARPQDRWIEGFVNIGREYAGTDAEVEISLRAIGASGPLETVRARPEGSRGRVMVDLRRWGLESASVTARLLSGGVAVGAAESLLAARPLPAAPAEGFRVPLVVNLPAGPDPGNASWPLHFGVPFPAGLLWSAGDWRVEDEGGRAFPTQLEVSGLWSREGAVQWLRVDTAADPRVPLFLVHRPGTPAPGPGNPVSARREGDRVILATGDIEYEIAAGHSPIASIRRGGRPVAAAAGTRGLHLVDQRGRLAVASAEGAEIRVEADGPVAACVRIEGDYRTADGQALARHITRVELAAGETGARVTHTLVLTRDTNETWFREVGWEMELAGGTGNEAFFGTSREDPAEFRRAAADDGCRMIQESHYRFGAGENLFRVFEGNEQVHSGAVMGDWFLARNSSAALLVSCRDSARQHPKEFSVRGRLVTLGLFSPAAGEELDFRSETLAEKWNLRQWFTNDGWENATEARRAEVERQVENIRRIPSNAAGWAKTHHLLFAAPAPGAGPGEAAGLSAWHSRPVFGLADPAWTWRSRAMGPLHPRDPGRFPEAERLVDATLSFFASRVPVFGEWGFVDYWAGPHLGQPGKYPEPRRYRLTYTLRPDAWRVFARSGLREAYDFATLTNRAWADNHLVSHGDRTRTKGLFASAPVPDRVDSEGSLPFYWGSSTVAQLYSSTNLNQFIWDYHLTGYRRAGDQVRDFAGGIKTHLTPAVLERLARRDRVIMAFRALLQCYGFTWDEDLRGLAGAAADSFEEPESAIGLTEREYGSSTYKTLVDVRALLEAWELLGDPRYRRLARLVSDYLWQSMLCGEPIGYTNPQGTVGHFLWEETGNPMIPQSLLAQMRWMSSRYDAASEYGVSIGAHAATPIFEGIPAIQDIVARTGADRRPTASWAAARDFENPVAFYFFKPADSAVTFSLKTPAGPGHSAGGSTIEALNPPTVFDTGLMGGSQEQSGYTRWKAPRDLSEMSFRVTPAASGTHYGATWGRRKMVLHAPGYWVPWPPQDPPVRWYFMVPEEAFEPAIFFEGRGRLYDPGGDLRQETPGGPQWLEIPTDRPGLWSFEAVENRRLVRVRNLPPFFAPENPGAWFMPPVTREPEEEAREPFEPPDRTGFTAGVSGESGDSALFVSPRGDFSFEGGAERGEEGKGTDFLPFHEGTIEFWFRPAWGTFYFERGRRHTRQIMTIQTAREPWNLFYQMDYSGAEDRLDLNSHVFYAQSWASDGARRITMRNYRKFTVLEPGRWVHLALAWGPRTRPTAYGPREELPFVLYLDGRAGNRHHHEGVTRGMRPADMPRRLVFPRLNGAIDNLRVSDIMRYESDFTPPRRDQKPALDEHTRAFFSFDGTLEGVSGDGRAIPGLATP